MRFPEIVTKINNFFAVISGAFIAIMATFAFAEVILRNFFASPTIWTTNISQYLLLWAILLVSASTFENKGHVSVDFIRVTFARKYGVKYARMISIPCYCFCLVYIGILGWKATELFSQSLELGKLTLGMIQIPTTYLYAAIIFGCVLMMITVVCIILDLLSGNNQYASEEEI